MYPGPQRRSSEHQVRRLICRMGKRRYHRSCQHQYSRPRSWLTSDRLRQRNAWQLCCPGRVRTIQTYSIFLIVDMYAIYVPDTPPCKKKVFAPIRRVPTPKARCQKRITFARGASNNVFPDPCSLTIKAGPTILYSQ